MFSKYSPTLSQLGVHLPAHKLPLWGQWQCNRHGHTSPQASIEAKPYLFSSTSWCWWRQPRLGLHFGEPIWQHSPLAYTYPASAPLGLTWANLGWDNPLSLGCCPLGMLLESQLSVEPQPQNFRAVQNLISSPFKWKEGKLNQPPHVNCTTSIFMVARLRLTDSIQRVIALRAVFTFHPSMGITSSAITTVVSSAFLPSIRARVLCCNHWCIISIADDIYPWWDVLLQDVVKGNIPKQGSKEWLLWNTAFHLFSSHGRCCFCKQHQVREVIPDDAAEVYQPPFHSLVYP